MPANLPREWFLVEEQLREARTIEEKIKLLKKLISLTPKHKGTENLLAQLRKRLSKLKKEKESKAKRKSRASELTIEKRGAAQICVIGLANSGKSALLKALTGKGIEVSEIPYTTKKPEVAMATYEDVQLQLIEIPSTFESYTFGILNNCDFIIALVDITQDIDYQKKFLEKLLKERNLLQKSLFVFSKIDLNKKFKGISCFDKSSLKNLLDTIWRKLNLIRVYPKPVGKKPEEKPLTLPKGSTVRDFTKFIHKDFLKNFQVCENFRFFSI